MKKNINGILLLNKPLHISSNHALQKVKRLFSAKKAGHTGNLDPLATGMLPICFGAATKFSQFLLGADKCYRVTCCLGKKTTTGDAEGEVIATRATDHLTQKIIEKTLPLFSGEIQQIPPMFSALKHKGKPLYELARQGIEVDRLARTVHIYELTLEKFSQDQMTLFVRCSKGTYIRTLVEDIGEHLQCGAYVTELHRTQVFPYQENQMINFSALEKAHHEQGAEGLMNFLLPIEAATEHFPKITLTTSTAFYLKNGQPVRMNDLPITGLVRLFINDQFLGIGEVLPDRSLAPRRIL